MKRIQSYWPQIETDNYIDIVGLKIIDQAFKARNVVLIRGDEGSGKTTLAIEYAKSSDSGVVVWFASESARKIDDRLQLILKEDLQLSPDELSKIGEQTRVEAICKYVGEQKKTPHLFVFEDLGEAGMPTVQLFIDSSLPANLRLLLVSGNAKTKQYADEHKEIIPVILGGVDKLQAEKYFAKCLQTAGVVQAEHQAKIFEEVVKKTGKLTPSYLKRAVAAVKLFVAKHNAVDTPGMSGPQLQSLISELKLRGVSKCLLELVVGRVECERLLDRMWLLDYDEAPAVILEDLMPSRDEFEPAVQALKQVQIIGEFTVDGSLCFRLLVRLVGVLKKAVKQSILEYFVRELGEIGIVTEPNKRKAAIFQRHIYKLLEGEKPSRLTVALYERLITIEEVYRANSRRANDLKRELEEQKRQVPPASPEIPPEPTTIQSESTAVQPDEQERQPSPEISKIFPKPAPPPGSRQVDEFPTMKWKLIEKSVNFKIYTTWDPRLFKNVAIKEVEYDANVREMKNVQMLEQIRIQFMVNYYGFFIREPKLYTVMELCRDGNLRKLLMTRAREGKRIDDDTVKAWSRQLTLVIIFLQENNIVHNDIKPENILVDNVKNCIKLADIGVAVVVDKYKTVPSTGGTHAYMAPERLLSEGGYSSTDSDVWSAGIVFYELVYLETPFENFHEFKKNPYIRHEGNPLGQLFRPIFEGIFVEIYDTKRRLQPREIFSQLQQGSEVLPINEHRLAKLLKVPTNKRIQGSIPEMVVKNQIDIMDVSTIEAAFNSSNVVMLQGVGGSGKSTQVADYARKLERERHAVVAWFNADSVSMIGERMQDILVRDLEIEADKAAKMDESALYDAIFEHIGASRALHLFVFDSIVQDGLDMLMRVLETTRPPDNLKILVTFEATEEPAKFAMNKLHMGPIQASDAKQLLLYRLSKRISPSILETIFGAVIEPMVDLTPFHLEAVVTSLEMHNDLHNGIKAADCPSLIQKLKSVNISDCVLSYLKEGSESRQIVELAIFLDADQIALDVIKLLVGDAEKVRRGVEELDKYQIVKEFTEPEEDKKCIWIHKLLVQSMRDNKKLGSKERSQLKQKIMAAFFAELDDAQKTNQRAAQRAKALQRHIFKLLEDTSDADVDTLRLYEKVIMIEKTYNFNFKSAIERSKKLIALKRDFYRKKFKSTFHFYSGSHASIAETLCDLAETLRQIGEHGESIQVESIALKMYLEIYKGQSEHVGVARCLHGLGMSHLGTGDYLSALDVLREALWINRRIHAGAQDHPDLATSLRLIGMVHERTGNLAEAKDLYTESLAIYRRIYADSPNHVTICAGLKSVAEVYRKLGDHVKAVKLYTKSLEMCERIYASEADHPDIAAGYASLAEAYKSAGDFAEAVELHKYSLKLVRKFYRGQPDNPAVAASLTSLASACEAADNQTEAARWYKELLELQRRVHKEQPEHADVAAAHMSLAAVYERRGKYSKALMYLESAEIILRAAFKHDPTHPQIQLCFEAIRRVNDLAAEKKHAQK